VVRKPKKEGLTFLAFTSGYSCMIRARIPLPVTTLNTPDGSNVVQQCIHISNFLKMLKALHAQNSLTLECFDEGQISYKCFPQDESQMTHYTQGTIKLLSETIPSAIPEFSGMKFERTINMSLNEFRNILNSAVAIKATEVTLTVREMKEEQKDGKVKITSLFIIGFTSDIATSQTVYPSSCIMEKNSEQDSTVIIKACDTKSFSDEEIHGDETKYVELVRASYVSTMLHNIVKNMPTSNLILNMSKDKPLVIQYGFGENANLAFAIAPRIVEDDNMD